MINREGAYAIRPLHQHHFTVFVNICIAYSVRIVCLYFKIVSLPILCKNAPMEHFGVINYLTYVIGVILIVLLPGPNSLYVLSLSAQQGRRAGWAAAIGVFVGDSILMTLTAVGAVTVLTAYPALFILLKIAGAVYLTYLGTRLMYGAWLGWKQQNMSDKSTLCKPISAKKAFNKALVVSLLNPKAILFFLSFFVQFVNPEYSITAIPFIILAVTLQFFSIIYLGTLIYAGDKLATIFRKRHKVSAVSSGSVGVGFVAFAVKLALASAS